MTDSVTIDNISRFFEIGKYHHRVFDMSRRVQRFSNQRFKRIEIQEEIYPVPFQQHASLGLLFWKPESPQEPVIWFLKFPLDELGFLKLETRDAFIQQLLEQVGEKIKSDQGMDADDSDMKESEFAFKPGQEKMAIFNAFATAELHQPPSNFYTYAQEYMHGDVGYDQWNFIGLQGIADMVARLSEDGNEAALIQAVPNLPDVPLVLLAQLLENVEVSVLLSQALSERLRQELENPLIEETNIAVVAAILRGLSVSVNKKLRKQVVLDVLATEHVQSIEVIAAISSRVWRVLLDASVMLPFMEVLAKHEQEQFNAVLLDLLPIPEMRQEIMSGFRHADRSENLSLKIGGFMGMFR
ncbi:MAG: Flagellar biosynthesis protein FlhF [uncultured Thiotrichaceae bacterium]|uniref:Flagellar biosynthesis protein FlhF n=1 Tax=uncultured Thiotrichaceae bacterium TaxID=298394 RepID=A0A6S6T3E9_9GAMM|nr:MAG: Flagellar biosynthesis protein FlhF [uncultured Thiotrichaceae bacterium]